MNFINDPRLVSNITTLKIEHHAKDMTTVCMVWFKLPDDGFYQEHQLVTSYKSLSGDPEIEN